LKIQAGLLHCCKLTTLLLVQVLGAEATSRARVTSARANFTELTPILTSKGGSLKMKGKVYKAGVQRVMVYGNETSPMLSEDMQRWERAERLMVR